MKVIPINPSIKPVLERFLTCPSLQEEFLNRAKKLGYTGTDPEKVKVALFTPTVEGEICFADNEVFEMFVVFQIREQLTTTEPYKTLLMQNPIIEAELIRISRDILDGKEADQDELLNLFSKEK